MLNEELVQRNARKAIENAAYRIRTAIEYYEREAIDDDPELYQNAEEVLRDMLLYLREADI